MAKAAQLNFTNVKEGGNFSKRHQPSGDYLGKVTKVADAKSKSDGTTMWLYTIEVNGASYPFYCKHQENQLWKIRNIFIAAGVNIPKKMVKVDPNKIVGKSIGVTLEDEEYEGKMQSVVQATFPTSELDETVAAGADDEVDDDDEEVDEAPASKAKSKKSKAEEPADDDEDEEPAPKKKKGKKGKKAKSNDDELEELDVDAI